MRRIVAAVLLSLAVGAGACIQAVFAEDEGTPPQGKLPAANAPNPSDNEGKAKKRNSADSSAKPPKVRTIGEKPAKKSAEGGFGARMASTIVGSLAGIPVAAVRHSKQEIINAAHDLVGDTDNKWLWAAASPLCVPAGILSGVMQSVVVAPYNAWKFSADEPFSAEAFSLGDAK